MSKGIALYARVSSDRQAQEGTIESQIEAIREFAQANTLKIDDDLIFTDNGVSGALLERPALDALRDKAAVGHVAKVLIHNPDRLARKHAHQLILVEELQKLGAEIVFVNHSISTSPEDQLLLQIQGVISEYEREKIMERHRRGKLHKAKQGKVNILVCAPYGYVYVRKGDKEDARYDIKSEEAAVVKRIFDMFCRKMLSIRAIGRVLTQEQIPTRKQVGHWEPSVVWGMLRNPAYVGRAAYRKTKIVPRIKVTKLVRDRGGYPKHGLSSSRARPEEEWITVPVPAIIDEKTFVIARERLEENKRLSPRNNKTHEYLLSGLLHCKECGYSIYGDTSNSKYRRAYYRCMGQDGFRWPKGRVCGGHPVRVEALDDLVWDATKSLIQEPKVVLEEYTRRLTTKKRANASFEAMITQKEKEAKHFEREKERLIELYQSGSVSLKEIESRIAKIRTKMQNSSDEQNLLRREMEQESGQLKLVEQFEVFSRKIVLRLDELTFTERKEIVRLLVTEVVMDTQKDEILIRHIIPGDKVCRLCSRGH